MKLKSAFTVLALSHCFHFQIIAAELCSLAVEQLRTDFRALAQKPGLGYRGYLAFNPSFSAESRIAAFAEGINYWGMRILIAKDSAAAEQRDKLETNPLLKAFFILGDETIDPHASPEEKNAYFVSALENGLHWFEDGEEKILNATDAKQVLNIPNIEWHEFEEVNGQPEYGFYQKGWFFTKLRGIISYDDVLASSTYKKKIRANSRSFTRAGFKVTFNKAFDEALTAVEKQIRREGGTSRYSESYKAMLRALFRSGNAFSVEIWNAKGILVGGSVGLRYENLFKGDSVFYLVDEDGTSHIEYAKMAVNALVDRLNDNGIQLLDVGMVSEFTKHMKGKYIRGSEFLTLLAELQKQPSRLNFSDSWQWQEVENAKLPSPVDAK